MLTNQMFTTPQTESQSQQVVIKESDGQRATKLNSRNRTSSANHSPVCGHPLQPWVNRLCWLRLIDAHRPDYTGTACDTRKTCQLEAQTAKYAGSRRKQLPRQDGWKLWRQETAGRNVPEYLEIHTGTTKVKVKNLKE